jgi:large subunit ribosomal protein L28
MLLDLYGNQVQESVSSLGGVKMAKCCICSKGVVFGHNVSHSERKTGRTWKPNIRKVKLEGSKAIYVCSRCLRTMKKA